MHSPRAPVYREEVNGAARIWVGLLGLGLLAASCGSSGGGGFTGSGTGVVTEFRLPTPGLGPGRITAGIDGSLWLLGTASSRTAILRVTPDGVFTEFALPSTIRFPSGLISGTDGFLWFVDQANHLEQVDPGGGAVQGFAAMDPSAIALGPDRNFWVPEFNGGKVDVYSASGAKLHSYPAPTIPSGRQLESIALGDDGNLWITTFSGENVIRMTPGGSTATFVYTAQVSGTFREITRGPDGNLWLCAEDASAIVRLTLAGAMTVYPLPTAGADPNGITTGSDGNLWFTEYHANQIGRITPSGVITEFPIPTAGSGPFGITAGPDGNLWFTEAVANQVAKIHP